MNYEPGSLVEGIVVDVVRYGAFVKIRGGKTGLIHISRISDKFVRDVGEYVTVGSNILSKVISIDEKGRMQLSLKDVTEEEAEAYMKNHEDSEGVVRERASGNNGGASESAAAGNHTNAAEQSDRSRRPPEEEPFEKKLKRFLRQSEERMVDLKRSVEGKRGGQKKKRKK